MIQFWVAVLSVMVVGLMILAPISYALSRLFACAPPDLSNLSFQRRRLRLATATAFGLGVTSAACITSRIITTDTTQIVQEIPTSTDAGITIVELALKI